MIEELSAPSNLWGDGSVACCKQAITGYLRIAAIRDAIDYLSTHIIVAPLP